MPSARLLGRPDPDQVMVDRELADEVDVVGPASDGFMSDDDIPDSDPETHWGLEKQTKRLKSPPPPPREQDDDVDDDNSSTDDNSSSTSPASAPPPTRKLVPRSQIAQPLVNLDSSSAEESDTPVMRRRPKSQARLAWEGKNGNAVGKEDDISIPIGQPEPDKSGDEDEYHQPNKVLAVEEDDHDELALVSQVKDAVVRSSARKPPRQRPPPASSAAVPAKPTSSPFASSSKLPSSPSKRARATTPSSTTSTSTSADDPLQLQPTPSARTRQTPKSPTSSSDDLPVYTKSTKKTVTPTQPRRSFTSRIPAPLAISHASSDLSDTMPDVDRAIDKSLAVKKGTTSAKGKGKQKAVVESPMKKRRVAASEDDDDDEDHEPTPRRRSTRANTVRGKNLEDSEEDEDPMVIKASSSRKGKQMMIALSSDSDEDAEEVASSSDHSLPGKRRAGRVLNRKAKGTSERRGSDREDEDLVDSDGELPSTTETRLRTRVTRTGSSSKRMSALEKLHQQRTQKNNNGASQARAVVVSDDSDSDKEQQGSDDGSGGEDNGDGLGGVGSEDDEDEDDFIVEDDGHVDLPAEFQTVQPMAQQFAIVVQYHIYLLILGYERCNKQFGKDDYFQGPLRRVRTMMRDWINGKVRSSVWPVHYTKALEKYPRWDQDYLDGGPPCDACRITSRCATVKLDLQGKPYSRKSFNALDPEDSEADDHDADGLDREFNLGRYCAARSHLYHAFAHWEHDLHEFLEHEISRLPDEPDDSGDDDDVPPARQFVAVGPFARAVRGKRPANTDVGGIIEYFDGRGIMAEEFEKIEKLKATEANVFERGEEDQ